MGVRPPCCPEDRTTERLPTREVPVGEAPSPELPMVEGEPGLPPPGLLRPGLGPLDAAATAAKEVKGAGLGVEGARRGATGLLAAAVAAGALLARCLPAGGAA